MNIDAIALKECRNDGSHIYLYPNEDIAAWTAYGYSAYALHRFAKANGYAHLTGFSRTMQMPCATVGNEIVEFMTGQKLPVLLPSERCYAVRTTEKFEPEAYVEWTAGLRHRIGKAAEIRSDAPIGACVPRDKFIPDGMSAFARNVKRIGDCLLALLALVLFSPLFLLCYLAIRREDGGAAIFKQERIGRFGRPFNIYKFRSMHLDAESSGPQLSHSKGDTAPRLTKVGRFLRAHHLDELPQLWNVLCGDMAFIGPRPERKYYIDQIVEHDPRYVYLYQIRPGVTSYATLYNGYTDTMEKMLRRLEYDLYYLGHRSWWFDCKILFNTFCSIVFGKKF